MSKMPYQFWLLLLGAMAPPLNFITPQSASAIPSPRSPQRWLAQVPFCYYQNSGGMTISLEHMCAPSPPRCYYEDPQGRFVDLNAICETPLDQRDLVNSEEFLIRLMADKKCVECDLNRLGISGIFLAGADLRGSNLEKASLQDANLRNANLSGANLREANLVRTILAGADLSNADLTDAVISGADLSGANLSGAIMPDGSRHP